MERRRKVLFLIESLGGGGAEKVLSTLVEHIDKERFDVTVCPITDVGAYSAVIKKFVKVEPILPAYPEKGGFFARMTWRLKHRLVHKWLPGGLVYRLWIPKGNDVEVAFVEGLTTKLLSKSSGKAKKIAWVHTDLCNNHWTASLYDSIDAERKVYHAYDQVVGVSKIASESVNRLFGEDLRTVTIYNPIDAAVIKKKAVMSDQNIPPKKEGFIRICSAGRLVSQKGFDRLLRIVKRLTDEGRKVELWLLGNGELRPEFEKYVADNNLSDIVTLWGFKGNPYAYMAQCDLFVCSSVAEGYSLVIAEALVLGIPVISTKCSGPQEVLDNGKYDCLVENTEEGLYGGIKEFIDEFTKSDSSYPLRQLAIKHFDTSSILLIESIL